MLTGYLGYVSSTPNDTIDWIYARNPVANHYKLEGLYQRVSG